MLSARFSMVLFLEGLFSRLGGQWQRAWEARAARRELNTRQRPERQEKTPVIAPPEPRSVPKKPTKKKVKDETAPLQESFDFLEPSGNYHKPPLSVITSYSIHYTKLYDHDIKTIQGIAIFQDDLVRIHLQFPNI